jgi:hypothetical protein
VPPGTVHVSLTERYIPPSSSSEFAGLFDPMSGQSLVQDRLIELSGDDGLFLFIYPTKAGGASFMNRFLDKTLSPTLRQMVAMGDLNSEVCDQIENAGTVKELRSFDELNGRFKAFCEKISTLSSSNKFQAPRMQTTYTVVHSSRRLAKIPAEILAHWWCLQEKRRIRQVLADYIANNPSRSRSFSAPHNMTGLEPAYIARHRVEEAAGGASMAYVMSVLDGVHKRAKDSSADMNAGIEVAVFVVRKSAEMLKKQ